MLARFYRFAFFMVRARKLAFVGVGLFLGLAMANPANLLAADTPAVGVVFHDENGNGIRDHAESGLPDVGISNGRQVVMTDAQGRYQITIDDDDAIFLIKPRNWMTPVSNQRIPRFYYLHKPNGSPTLKFGGVKPTGPLPASIDFPLSRTQEPDQFRAVLFGDTQPANQAEIDYLAHDIIEEVVGVEAAFGVTLGDILFDDLSLFESLVQTVGLVGIPWYNVLGNHDMNYDSPDDVSSDETFERIFGPNYYAFNYGAVHFVVLDDVHWTGPRQGEERGSYSAALGSDQLTFIRNDLVHVDPQTLVVLMMHIPLNEITDRQELFDILKDRPNTLSIAAHEHYQRHDFFDAADGWRGPATHHLLVNVTTCGSWWRGIPDEYGIPNTQMRDGAPNGYSIIAFDGSKYSVTFKAARRPADDQMSIFAPEAVKYSEAAATEVLVNVFAGSAKSRVWMRFDTDRDWTEMVREEREDPYFARVKENEKGLIPPPGRPMPDIIKSPHIWKGLLPANPAPGSHLIHVRTVDMFGQEYQARRVIRITE